MSKVKKTGTYEWVEKTYNLYDGCLNICNYPCYARLIRRKTEEQWAKPIFKENKFNQKIKNYTGGFLANVMCFSAHDIYPQNQEICLKFILRILNESENTILITSKANLDTIKYLCENLTEYKERIRFMITITSMHDDVAVKYEPEAPLISERLEVLEYLDFHKWIYHISIEPYLDKYPLFLVNLILKKYENVKTIWIGCNSTKHLEIYTLGRLTFILTEINNLPKRLRSKIYLKDSFVKKYQNLTKKLTKNERFRCLFAS